MELSFSSSKKESAILLLGSRTKYDLKPKVQKELRSLLGAYPNVERAILWKKELKQIRKTRS